MLRKLGEVDLFEMTKIQMAIGFAGLKGGN